jgi:hypothetical protein
MSFRGRRGEGGVGGEGWGWGRYAGTHLERHAAGRAVERMLEDEHKVRAELIIRRCRKRDVGAVSDRQIRR